MLNVIHAVMQLCPLYLCCYAECHYAEYCNSECHNAEYCYTECHNTECIYAEYCFSKCLYAECCYADCLYPECLYAEYCCAECRSSGCHYAECRGVTFTATLLLKGMLRFTTRRRNGHDASFRSISNLKIVFQQLPTCFDRQTLKH